MSFLDSESYETSHDNLEKRAIISTYLSKNNQFPERISKDEENIRKLLNRLEFGEKEILPIQKKAINVLTKKTGYFCTIDVDDENGKIFNGYIIMFILTCKGPSGYNAYRSHYNTKDINETFSSNYLQEWTSQPKLIFYQATKNPTSYNESRMTQDGGLNSSDDTINLPINMDIFESFASNDNEDSLGDENGSFYIQAICNVINEHIDNETLAQTAITNIMYEVHAKIAEQVAKQGGKQVPYFKSTLAKDFIFPLKGHPMMLN